MRFDRLSVKRVGRLLEADVFFDVPVTAIVGPNEAGKTTLLLAMERLNSDEAIPAGVVTKGQRRPVVAAHFTLDEDDRAAVAEKIGPDLAKPIRTCTFTKTSGAITVALSTSPPPSLDQRKAVAGQLAALRSARFMRGIPEAQQPTIEQAATALASDAELTDSEITAIETLGKTLNAVRGQPHGELVKSITKLAAHEKATPTRQARAALLARRPKFLVFRPEHRDLQRITSISKAAKPGVALRNVAALAGLDLAALKRAVADEEVPTATNMVRRANTRLVEMFTQSWPTAGTAPEFAVDGADLHLMARDKDGDAIWIDERSDGLRSFVGPHSGGALGRTRTCAHGSGGRALSSYLPFAPPDAPDVTEATGQNASGTVYWTRPADNGSVITGYRITAKPLDDLDDYIDEPTRTYEVAETTASERNFTFGDLTNGVGYAVTVQAIYGGLLGPASQVATVWPATQPLGTPRVDLLISSAPDEPCWRNAYSDGALYVCRSWTTGTYVLPASSVHSEAYNVSGDVVPPEAGEPIMPPGGGNYVVHTADGMYEACYYLWSADAWTCGAHVVGQPSYTRLATAKGPSLELPEFWGWAGPALFVVGQVAVCLYELVDQWFPGFFGINSAIQSITDNCAHFELEA